MSFNTHFLALSITLCLMAGCAASKPSAEGIIDPATASRPLLYGVGFTGFAPLGMILDRPAGQPEGTKNIVSYEIGQCFQLDRKHCLLVASMDEQGGGTDLCVGNDAFVFSKISDIRADNAIPINRGQFDYKLPGHDDKFYLAKYPATGFFVPLDAVNKDGSPRAGVGTGLLLSECLPFRGDRSDPVQSWTGMVEITPISWDGRKLTVGKAAIVPEFLGQKVQEKPFGQLIAADKGFVGPFRFTDQKHHSVRFDWDGNAWAVSEVGPPFRVAEGEFEASVAHDGRRFLVATRGSDAKGRMYESSDGINFRFAFDWPNTCSPRTINRGLDGSLYLATNRNTVRFRNPLLMYPMYGNAFGSGTIIHDQSNVRNDNGDKLPVVDHPLGFNVFLDGRWCHLVFFRVCDTKERVKDKPIPKRLSSGLYAVEVFYDKVVDPPYVFAE